MNDSGINDSDRTASERTVHYETLRLAADIAERAVTASPLTGDLAYAYGCAQREIAVVLRLAAEGPLPELQYDPPKVRDPEGWGEAGEARSFGKRILERIRKRTR